MFFDHSVEMRAGKFSVVSIPLCYLFCLEENRENFIRNTFSENALVVETVAGGVFLAWKSLCSQDLDFLIQ